MSRACWRCGAEIGALDRVGRRDACLGCGADLHACKNCQHHDPAFHNQCHEPEAELQMDKEAGNFCELFTFRSAVPNTERSSRDEARARLEALFRRSGR